MLTDNETRFWKSYSTSWKPFKANKIGSKTTNGIIMRLF